MVIRSDGLLHHKKGGLKLFEYFVPFIYILGTAVFMMLTFATWNLMAGKYKPAQFIMNIFVERRKTAEVRLETAKTEQHTEQTRLERVRLEKTV